MNQHNQFNAPVKTLDQESKQWGMILHLSQLGNCLVPSSGIIAPIVIWQLKKDQLEGLDEHGRNVVNWMISTLIYGLISGLLCLVLIGFFMLGALAIANIAFAIIGAIKANDGVIWKYPGTISFF